MAHLSQNDRPQCFGFVYFSRQGFLTLLLYVGLLMPHMPSIFHVAMTTAFGTEFSESVIQSIQEGLLETTPKWPLQANRVYFLFLFSP